MKASRVQDIVSLRISEIHSLFENRQLSARELTQECLRRIEAEDGKWGAFIEVFGDEALKVADALDQRSRGVGALRPLHGIPIAVKDLIDIVGRKTSFGSDGLSVAPATADAQLVQRLRDAGAIIIGKSRLSEFAYEGWGIGVDRSPWNPCDPEEHRIAGGSSSGSGVAVAAGLVSAAIGSDTGGSIRIPAALCGVVGLKPLARSIPCAGTAALSPSLDCFGPLTRHVADAFALHAVLSGCRRESEACDIAAIRVVLVDPSGWGPVAPGVESSMHEAIAVLRGSGLSIRLTTLPRQFEDYQRLCGDLTDAEAARALKPFVEKLSGKDARRAEQFREGSHIDDDGLRRLYQQRSEDIKAFRRFSQEIDVILTPTVPISAIPIHEPKVNRPLPPLSRFTRLANYLDLIAISLPIRPTLNYLPVGLQLMCIPEREKALFNLARHAEERLSILSGGNR